MNEPKTRLRGVLMLLLTALIWGTAFVAQSVGMESVGAFTFSGVRTLLGALVLLPLVAARGVAQSRHLSDAQRERRRAVNRKTIRYGIILGLVFCCATNLQQFAFYESTPGKIAFITALYIFFVPLIGLPLGKRVPWPTWVGVSIGFIGLFFLCVDPADMTAINTGDLLTLICSVFFAVHILIVERVSADVDGIKLSCIQFAVAGVISCGLMFLFENPRWDAIESAAAPILYSGALSCGIAYTLQILGQKYTEATVASLLMCMESVFAVLASAILLPDTMLAPREIAGCVIMFAAIVLAQMSDKIAKRAKS
ncbi:MAG: DMT family transporter [Clostridia bacterium]|nr:DMT family transporter [Clostridia bacterium]